MTRITFGLTTGAWGKLFPQDIEMVGPTSIEPRFLRNKIRGGKNAFGYDEFGEAYKGKTVFVTGHTGFKGSWLSEWLLMLGANVVGYFMEPPTEPSHFAALQLGEHLTDDLRGDVRSLENLQAMLRKQTYSKPYAAKTAVAS